MAIAGGPDVIQDGLVLSLDAADRNSYPGSGTTWVDLSGNGYAGTLTNGPTYNSANQGAIVFDGTNDYVTFGNILNFGTSDFTIECWTNKSNAGVTFGKVISKGYYQESGWLLQTRTSMISFSWGNPQAAAVYVFASSIIGVWIHTVVTRSFGFITVYGNTVAGTPATIGTANLNSDLNFLIGDNGRFVEPWGGRVANVKIYNRALSASEIAQNYNSTKTRFGL